MAVIEAGLPYWHCVVDSGESLFLTKSVISPSSRFEVVQRNGKFGGLVAYARRL